MGFVDHWPPCDKSTSHRSLPCVRKLSDARRANWIPSRPHQSHLHGAQQQCFIIFIKPNRFPISWKSSGSCCWSTMPGECLLTRFQIVPCCDGGRRGGAFWPLTDTTIRHQFRVRRAKFTSGLPHRRKPDGLDFCKREKGTDGTKPAKTILNPTVIHKKQKQKN